MPEVPYLYTRPTSQYTSLTPNSAFDPKAYTRASWQSTAPSHASRQAYLRHKMQNSKSSNDPLVDFNRHPDSYLVLPYGQTNAKPMNPKTKTWIKWARGAQLGLRITQCLAAAGLLFCVICFKGMQDTEGWILRIPPGWDLLIVLYGIYHLLRPAKGRTPASSASYHFFALFMDVGLIPFYVFTALLANQNYWLAPGAEGRWRSFFNDQGTTQVLLVAWTVAVSISALHLASVFVGMYLVIVFRRISKLPPDFNPLEDNLTSRRKSTKHKHKNSEITLVDEKHRSTVSVDSPGRTAKDPLMADDGTRKLDFYHTRNDSAVAYNPHNPASASQARLSQYKNDSTMDLDRPHSVYQQASSARQSRMNLSVPDCESSLGRSQHAGSGISLMDPPVPNHFESARSSRPATRATERSLVSPPGSDYSPATKRESKESMKNDNWFVYNDDVSSDHHLKRNPTSRSVSPLEDNGEYDPYAPTTYAPSRGDTLRNTVPGKTKPALEKRDSAYAEVPQEFQHLNTRPLQPRHSQPKYASHDPHPQPLAANPPTPLSMKDDDMSVYSRDTDGAPTRTSTAGSRRPASPPKSRYYGSLRAATVGVRNSRSPSPEKEKVGTSPTIPSIREDEPAALFQGNRYGYSRVDNERGSRVISNSGAEWERGDDGAGSRWGGMRGRVVSGKLAEEGLMGR